MFHTAITALHICVCVLLILVVLLQQGRGADAGATFGGGSNTLFGASGADNIFTRATTILAFLFMTTAFSLAVGATSATALKSEGGRLFRDVPKKVEETTSPVEKTETPQTSEAPAAAGSAPATTTEGSAQ